MIESPSIPTLLARWMGLTELILLTILIRVGWFLTVSDFSPRWKWLFNKYRRWVLTAQARREEIIFFLFTDLSELSPEAYRSYRLWHPGT